MLLGSDEPGCNPVGFREELNLAETYFRNRQAAAYLFQARITDLSTAMEQLRVRFLYLDFASYEVCEDVEVPEDDSAIIRDAELSIQTGDNYDAFCAYKMAERRIKYLYQEVRDAAREAGGISLVNEWRKTADGLMNWAQKKPEKANAALA